MKTKDRIADLEHVYAIHFPNKGFLKDNGVLKKDGIDSKTCLFPDYLTAQKTLRRAIASWKRCSAFTGFSERSRREWKKLAELGGTDAIIVRVDFTPVS
jgi:hypothetical protein